MDEIQIRKYHLSDGLASRLGFIFRLHFQQFGKHKMVIVVAYHGIVVNLFKETSLQVNQVLTPDT